MIENLLWGFFDNPDILIRHLPSEFDETDRARFSVQGGFMEIFHFCQSDTFKEAFVQLDYVIIQIDTDVLRSNNVPKEYQMSFKHPDGQDFTVEEIVVAMKQKFIELMGEEFYIQFQNNIIFAISVHSVECWILPIYFKNQKAKAAKVENCLNTLNEALKKQESFYIDKKEPKYYREIAKKYRKNKDLMAYYQLNPSLKIFIESLPNIK
ncbi:MAG: phage tail protein [Saprospiraceae bacterium]